MKLKETKWETCTQCGRNLKIVQEESYGCDWCKKPIDDLLNSANQKHADYLELQVFHINHETEHYQFCCWACMFKKLKTIKTDYFISLPFLTFDQKTKGQTVEDFWRCISTR
ncbi:MAG: hypothetical protein ACFFCW_19875 [Candidatus Hodarchaeota archaeon]